LEIVEMARACIVGWVHTPFGKLEDPDVESLIARVSDEALKHADVGPEAVNGIYVGAMDNGLSKQGFEGAQVALNQSALAYVQATYVENPCATGAAALYTARDFIESGRGRVALVAGAEKNDRDDVG
jgi:acetyl-CoA C-acetyltransferase